MIDLPLNGRHLLVVEDEFLIAEDLAGRLEDAGAIVIGPVGCVDEALALIEAGAHIDAALLDVNLRGRSVYPVADALMARGVPILFVTGYERDALPSRFDHVLRSGKPAQLSTVIDVVSKFCGPGEAARVADTGSATATPAPLA